MTDTPKIMHGLPEDVLFCKRCVMSNQRPSTAPEHLKQNTNIATVEFDENGVCSACRHSDLKENEIDWGEREAALRELLSQYRTQKGSQKYDVLVPGSGGKDSIYVAHLLKYEYGMNPLTVTWSPHIYTDIGWHNFQKWIHSGFDNILHTPNGKVHGKLTRLAFENLCNPFQPFIMGQKYLMAKIAAQYDIPLIMYGENQAEYHNCLSETQNPRMDPSYFSREKANISDLYFSGLSQEELEQEGIYANDLIFYTPLERQQVEEAKLDIHYMSYYRKWLPQKAYYYSVEHAGFEPNPHGRSEGTYSKYASLDDKIDGFHYYTMFVKFGQGRATSDAAHEIRDGHITREEAVALVRKYDGEFPARHYQEFLSYTGLTEERFWEVINANRSPHLWDYRDGEWQIKHQVE